MRRAGKCVFVLTTLAGLAFAQATKNQNTILGVLEEVPGIHYGEGNSRAVQIVFQKSGRIWQAFRSECPDHDCGDTIPPVYPEEIRWTIVFDGKSIGKVVSKAVVHDRQFSPSYQEIVSTGPVPKIGKRTEEFADASLYRPLIANSQPYFADPDQWRPFEPGQNLLRQLRTQFRKQFPTLCHLNKNHQSKLEPFLYRDDEVNLVKAYHSRTGWIVARVHLGAIGCNDTEAGFEMDDPWFVVDPSDSTSFLGSGLRLVDAGDYDNDGKSELVFAISRDNEGGYELFYEDFRKRVVFEFGYH